MIVPFESPGISHLTPWGSGKSDRVREAEAQVQRPALELRAVARADELERLRVALGDALDHAGDERPGEALEARAVAAARCRR